METGITERPLRILHSGMFYDKDFFIPVKKFDTTEVAALGRPLYPGMLYDCHKDSFIPGVTLWDQKKLQEDLNVHPLPKTDLKFSASDSLNDKTNLLDVSASLKASFFGGLVEVDGSAKYLKDTKSSAHQSRVTLHYSQTTRFEQLTMAELGNITYPQVLEQNTATHVISAVLYGAHAFMVFDHVATDSKNEQEVSGILDVIVKKIPSLSIEGKGTLTLKDNEKKIAENTSVTFYGDYELSQNPTSYSEALAVYKMLPRLLKEKANDAVPVKVWLYPLTLLDDKATSLVREISVSILSKIEILLEELEEAERRCNDLINKMEINTFLDVKGRLQMFKMLYSDYKIGLQKALKNVLPAVRSGEQEEQVLANILTNHYKSPFTAENLNQWLDNTTSELNMLCSYIKGLKDITVVTSSVELNGILFDPDVNVVVCLSFTSLKYEDSFLETLKDFLNSDELVKIVQPTSKPYIFQEMQPWFTSSDISKNMKQNLSLFTSFSNANKNAMGIRFIIVSNSDPNNPGSSIQLYKDGKLIDPKYQPVSKPPPPVVEMQDKAVALKLQKSPTGDTLRFRVEYRMVKAGDANQQEPWKTRDTPDAQSSFILTELQPDTQYWIQYKAVSVVGVSEASESVQRTQTHRKFPPVPITDADLNPITLVGGNCGSETIFLTHDGKLRKIKVYLGQLTVGAMSVTLSDNEGNFGKEKNEQFNEFTFQDGDVFRSLTLWPNSARNRLGGIVFEVVRENRQIETFSAQIPCLGQPVPVDVGSGVCCGVKVRSGGDIDALGFIFIKKFK